MGEQIYTSKNTLGHTGLVTGKLYLYVKKDFHFIWSEFAGSSSELSCMQSVHTTGPKNQIIHQKIGFVQFFSK